MGFNTRNCVVEKNCINFVTAPTCRKVVSIVQTDLLLIILRHSESVIVFVNRCPHNELTRHSIQSSECDSRLTFQ